MHLQWAALKIVVKHRSVHDYTPNAEIKHWLCEWVLLSKYQKKINCCEPAEYKEPSLSPEVPRGPRTCEVGRNDIWKYMLGKGQQCATGTFPIQSLRSSQSKDIAKFYIKVDPALEKASQSKQDCSLSPQFLESQLLGKDLGLQQKKEPVGCLSQNGHILAEGRVLPSTDLPELWQGEYCSSYIFSPFETAKQLCASVRWRLKNPEFLVLRHWSSLSCYFI